MVTRPAAIQSSASRREQTPVSPRYLFRRIVAAFPTLRIPLDDTTHGRAAQRLRADAGVGDSAHQQAPGRRRGNRLRAHAVTADSAVSTWHWSIAGRLARPGSNLCK